MYSILKTGTSRLLNLPIASCWLFLLFRGASSGGWWFRVSIWRSADRRGIFRRWQRRRFRESRKNNKWSSTRCASTGLSSINRFVFLCSSICTYIIFYAGAKRESSEKWCNSQTGSCWRLRSKLPSSYGNVQDPGCISEWMVLIIHPQLSMLTFYLIFFLYQVRTSRKGTTQHRRHRPRAWPIFKTTASWSRVEANTKWFGKVPQRSIVSVRHRHEQQPPMKRKCCCFVPCLEKQKKRTCDCAKNATSIECTTNALFKRRTRVFTTSRSAFTPQQSLFTQQFELSQ